MKEHNKRIMMKTSSEITNAMVKDGYTENFKVNPEGLYAPSVAKHYKPDDLDIVNFYRFEGESDPSDSSILYIIETNDGVKGTLLDAYGMYANEHISRFMRQIEEIAKKNNQK